MHVAEKAAGTHRPINVAEPIAALATNVIVVRAGILVVATTQAIAADLFTL